MPELLLEEELEDELLDDELELLEEELELLEDELEELLEEELGLADPIPVQYWNWISGLAQGDLGFSYVSELPAIDEIAPRIPITAKLAVLALFFSVLFGLPLGVLSAVHQDSKLDYVLRVISLSGLSLPSFWLGLLILMAFVTTGCAAVGFINVALALQLHKLVRT